MTLSTSGQQASDLFLESLEALDADRMAGQFMPEGQLWIGEGPAATGQAAVRKAFVRWLSRAISVSWQVVHRWIREDVTVLELDLKMVRDDYGRVTVPVTFTFWAAGPKLRACRISVPHWAAH